VREKRGQFTVGHGAEEIRLEYMLRIEKRGKGWLFSCFFGGENPTAIVGFR